MCLSIPHHIFISNRIKMLTYLLNYWITYSMEQSPSWETNWFAASQEIPHILWNLKIHYHIHKCPHPVPILSQLEPVHTPTSHFLKIHLNIILPSMPGSPKWSLYLRFPHQNPVYASPLPHTHYMSHPSHSSWFYHSNNTGRGVETTKLSTPVTSSLLGRNILLNTLFSNTLSLCSSLVSDQVSHPYKTWGHNYSSVYLKMLTLTENEYHNNFIHE